MIRQSRIAPFVMLNESLGASDLSGSPMCVNSMKVLIRANTDGGIKLTKSGAFYRRFVTWATEDFRWPDYEAIQLYAVNKVLNEPDFLPLAIMHELMIGARLLRHYKGAALSTKAGKAMIGDYGALQAELFDAFFIALDHGSYERFPIEYDDGDIVHYLKVIDHRMGDWVALGEIAGWCLPIDLFTSERISPLLYACYHLHGRLIRPLLWLGLIDRHPDEGSRVRIEDRRYRKTPLFDRFLSFKTHGGGSATIH